VRPGTVTTVSRAGISERAYWRLESRPHADDLGTTITRVRELMEDTVAEQLVADVPLCTLLSGGLDSSAMTALAAGYRRRQGAVVRSFAVDFTGHAEHFSPELVVQRDIDTPFARQVAATAGTDHTDIVLDSVGLADPSLRERAIRARDLPIGHGDLDTSLLLLFARIGEHSTVALSGEAADELFGGYTQFFDPQAQRADAWPWIVHFRHQHDAELAMLTEELRNALDLETFWADSYASAIAPVDRIAGTSDFEHRMRKINYLHVTRSAQHLLDRKDRLSMAVGLEVRVPYCDHRLVEYVYNAPWAYKSHHGREKDLLRSAASDLLPRAVLDRVKSGYPATPHPAYLQAIQNQGADLAARVNHPVFELIRNDWLQETAHTPVDELPRTARKGMHLALGLAQWIDMYEPAITLS
jgi:asparagine synthase (glutamine-hydrolysing)